MIRRAREIALCLALLCIAGCEPWGKPAPEGLASNEITDFSTLFNYNCSGCHGQDGKNGPGRILNDALYLAVIPKDALRQVIANGRPGTAMPAWSVNQGGPLTEKQITALVDGMEQNWAKPVDLRGAKLPAYAETDVKGDPSQGKRLFARDCFACHGKGAPIGPVTDPNYLLLTTHQNLRTSVIVGRPDMGMPDYRTLNLGRALSDQDVSDLVAYMASLSPAEAGSTGGSN